MEIDELRFCNGCSEWRHITHFKPGLQYCSLCYAAHMARIDRGLREGTFAPTEVIRISEDGLELPRPITPDDHLSYTVKDDVTDLTTDELNAMATGRRNSPEWLEDLLS